MIKLKNVTKKFGKISAVNDASFKIEEKQRLVILGPSGCGKTTILRLIAGFEKPDEGEIHIDGRLASNPQILIPANKRNIGMVFQDLALWPHMNVADNIGFGLENVFKDRQKRDEEIDNIIKLMHLKEKSSSYPAQLSGGEQQRVALARALIRRPQILLMDESLANLELELKEKLLRLIIDLQVQFNITLVYVTHDEYAAKVLAERVALMRQGRIERIGQKSEVLK